MLAIVDYKRVFSHGFILEPGADFVKLVRLQFELAEISDVRDERHQVSQLVRAALLGRLRQDGLHRLKLALGVPIRMRHELPAGCNGTDIAHRMLLGRARRNNILRSLRFHFFVFSIII